MNGVSLSTSRQRIESADRGDLVVSYQGPYPVRLRGSVLQARSEEIPTGLTRDQLRARLGDPSLESGAAWIYLDPDRHAQLRVEFWHDRGSGFTVLRWKP